MKAKELLGISKNKNNNWHTNHAIFKDILEKIPEAMQDPLCIMDSINHPGRIVVILDIDMLDEKDNASKVFIPLEINKPISRQKKSGKKNIAHIMTTIYPRALHKISDDIQNILSKNLKNDYSSQIYYLNGNKNKTASIRPTRVQFPIGLIKNSLVLRQRIAEKYNTVNENFFQKQQQVNSTNNGSTEFRPDGQRIISLFETADESTFLHEMGHIFLKDLEELAKIDEKSAKMNDPPNLVGHI